MAEARSIGLIGGDRVAACVAKRFTAAGRQIHFLSSPESIDLSFPSITESRDDRDIRSCEFVLSGVARTSDLKHILFEGETGRGLASRLKPGAIVIDLGMRSGRDLRDIKQRLAAHSVTVMDAVLIGSLAAINTGTLRVLAGGSSVQIERANSILSILGNVAHTGALGSAHITVAMMGYTRTAHILAVEEEASVVGYSAGIVPETLSHTMEHASLMAARDPAPFRLRIFPPRMDQSPAENNVIALGAHRLTRLRR